jgi:hypothetical protein
MTPGNFKPHFQNVNHVGGWATLPSTSCLRAAYVADYPAACVERTRSLQRVFFRQTRSQVKMLIFGSILEDFHARTVSD